MNAEQLREKARELLKQGNKTEADRLFREAKKIEKQQKR